MDHKREYFIFYLQHSDFNCIAGNATVYFFIMLPFHRPYTSCLKGYHVREIFVFPFSSLNTLWILYPYNHKCQRSLSCMLGFINSLPSVKQFSAAMQESVVSQLFVVSLSFRQHLALHIVLFLWKNTEVSFSEY